MLQEDTNDRHPVFRDPEADAAEQKWYTVTYRFCSEPTKVPTHSLWRSPIPNSYGIQRTPDNQSSPGTSEWSCRTYTFPDFKTYYKTTTAREVWDWSRDWHVSRWNRIEIPDINPCVKLCRGHLGFPEEEMMPFSTCASGEPTCPHT